MSDKFKQLEAAKRAAVPQIDPEAVSSTADERPTPPSEPANPDPRVEPMAPTVADAAIPPSQPTGHAATLTPVNTKEPPVNRGFFMYPSRHRQVAKDLAYIEDRKPWMIIEDALDEYVVKHYGQEYKRR
jgi:hypothetical protein